MPYLSLSCDICIYLNHDMYMYMYSPLSLSCMTYLSIYSVQSRVYVIFSLSLSQAFKKMNKDLKQDQIELLKSKYGIDLEADK